MTTSSTTTYAGSTSTARRRTGQRVDIDQAQLAELLREYFDKRDRATRNRIVESQMHLVEHYVRRYRRSERAGADDLRQTALMALIGAVDRFDPNEGTTLRTFASRTIEGELKRYLRDKTWMVRPPRSIQEIHLNIRQATEELLHETGRSPTVPELASHLRLDEERVIQGLVAASTRDSESLSRSLHGEDGPILEDTLSVTDDRFDLTEMRMVLRQAVNTLDERELHALRLRFLDELTQPEIAELIGLSQSYVSRLIRSGLSRLRAECAR